MTDEAKALVEELRLNDSEIYLPLLGKAADQIEADGRRIAELEQQVAELAVANSYLREALKEARAALGEDDVAD